MLRLKWQFLMAVGLVLTGCGQWRATALRWPAKVKSIQGIEGAALSLVEENIEALNEDLGTAILHLTGGDGSEVYIRRVESFESQAGTTSHTDYAQIGFSGRSAAGTTVAGRATLLDLTCVIELADFLFEKGNKSLLQSVLWHEIGHCAGLPHVKEERELMSPLTLRFSEYSEAKIQRFFDDVLNSIQPGK